MAAAARHAHAVAPAPRRDTEARPEAPTYAYRAPHTRRRAAQRSRLTRTFVIFVACLTVLAVGRVALSFAVVQKSLQTGAIVRAERRISEQNGELREEVARLSSTSRIRHIAESELGLVEATHFAHPDALLPAGASEVAATR
jgi:cell division protein FtsL